MAPGGDIFRKAALLGSLAIAVPASVVAGLLAGRWLDGRFGTRPWLTLAGVLAGMGAAVVEVLRVLAAADRMDGRRDGR